MVRLLVISLLWVSIVSSDPSGRTMREAEMEPILMQKMMMSMKRSMHPEKEITSKQKRYFVSEPPCPPFYPNHGAYLPPVSFSRPYGPPSYPKTHQPTYVQHQPYSSTPAPIYKPITKQYAAYEHQTTVEKPIYSTQQIQQHLFKPAIQTIAAKPLPSYETIYKEALPSYDTSYREPMYQPISYAKALIAKPISYSGLQLNKYHYSAPQPIYQKQSQLINYETPQSTIIASPKVVQIPQSISYPKISHHIQQQPWIQSAPSFSYYGSSHNGLQSLSSTSTTISPPALSYSGYNERIAPAFVGLNQPC